MFTSDAGCQYVWVKKLTKAGARPWSSLQVLSEILKSILKLIGSQCEDNNVGLVCSLLISQAGKQKVTVINLKQTKT